MAGKRAQALRASTPAEDVKQPENKAATPETVTVPAALLLAAESIAAKADKERSELRGVMLHMKETGLGRVVSADGDRLFVGAFGSKGAPAWLKSGLMLAQEDLKARVSMLQKVAGTGLVELTYAKGEPLAVLSDPRKTMMFKIMVGPVTRFPDYEDQIKVASFADFDTVTGEAASRDEWKPIGLNSRHLKHCGDLAKILESGIAKEDRDPDGMVVRMFSASETAPRVFDFQGWPGALLVLGATLPGSPQLAVPTVALLSGPLKLTVAALRAHETRWRDAAEAATTDEQRAACNAKADTFRDRVARVMATAPDPKLALPAPAEAAGAVAIEGNGAGGNGSGRIPTRGEKSAATRRKRAQERAATVH